MKTIHKFRIDTGKDITTLTLREGYRIVRCEYVLSDKAVYLWVEQPLSVSTPSIEQRFRVAHSGEPVPDDFSYAGTAVDPFGPEAYHLFQLPNAVKRSVTPIRQGLTSAHTSSSAALQRASA
ncbi:DUF7352 domain-containing protein [Allohahella marinimesophila]|uniref:DUF7352 domain-containing protein n=1 Tax=Allohahella marinimesophila TaxID=1054972 RepID=A0ABP7Q2D4_9GAMM